MDLTQNRDGAAQKLWPLDRGSIWKPLDKEKREIRILLLQPSEEEDDALYADLEIVSLDSEPEYKAISYVWGDATDTTVMFVNGGRAIEITRSLAAALRCFRDSRAFVALWADAVCINQEDLQERADQVRIMGWIYASAIQVNVWLGRVRDRGWFVSLHGFLGRNRPRTADQALRDYESIVEGLLPRVSQSSDLDLSEHGDPWILWLVCLSHCPWFSRLWVIQEVASARSVRMFSGRHSCTLGALVSVVKQIEGSQEISLPERSLVARTMGQLLPVFSAKATPAGAPSIDVMKYCNLLRCEDDRDKVYGLLGLTKIASDLSIDYNKTVEQVFIDFAVACIAKEDLTDVLLFSAQRSKHSTLPSWVPDWRDSERKVIKHVWSSVVSRKRRACPRIVPQKPKYEPGKLRVSAVVVEELHAVAQSLSNIAKDTVQRNRFDQQVELNREWKRFLRSHHQSFWQIVCWDHDPDVSKHTPMLPAHMEKIERSWTAHTQDPHNFDMSEEKFLILSSLATHFEETQPFLTVSGRPGSSNVGAREGDLVILISGCEIPFVVRPAAGETFRLIGSCYVQGIMDGEALAEMIKMKADEAEQTAFMCDYEAFRERIAAGIEVEERWTLLMDLIDRHCRGLFQEMVLI